MSIIVRGMEMPKDCRECPMQVYYSSGKTWCKSTDRVLSEDYKPIPYDGIPDWCPLVELPEKHGRLIDADELMNESRKDEAYGYVDTKQIYDAPTVIEAEGKG